MTDQDQEKEIEVEKEKEIVQEEQAEPIEPIEPVEPAEQAESEQAKPAKEEVKETIGPSPTPGKDLLLGIGISILAYGFIMLLFISGFPMTFVSLFSLLIFSVIGILIVKFFRTKRTNAAVIMIVLIAPALILTLLIGSCALLFMGL